MIRVLFVTTILLSASAMAQTGPCSAGIQDPPIFGVVPESPVRLSFSNTTQAMLSPPVISIAGTAITVVQLASGANQFRSPDCNRQSISLGDLPPGSYTVTWNYEAGQSPGLAAKFFFATFSFAFKVPGAGPCVLGMSIEPQWPPTGQPLSIVYSEAIDGNQITIDQPAFIADPAFPGHVPCARGAVQVGSLQPGYYVAVVRTMSGDPLSASFVVRPLTRGRAVRGH